MEKIKVLLVDDHQIVRDGIKSLLMSTGNIDVVGEAADGYELIDLLKTLEPHIVLMDINLPKISGIETVKILREDYPGLKILMLSMYTNEDFVLNSIKAGANGYIEKNTTKRELKEAIMEVYYNGEYFGKNISKIIMKSTIERTKAGFTSPLKVKDNLTPREIELLVYIVDGLSNTEIAEKLCISIRTVETHKSNILKKLGASNTVDLVKFAIKNNIVTL